MSRPSHKKKVARPENRKSATPSKKTSSPSFAWLGLGIILIVTVFCYQPMMRHSFTNWDDDHYVLNNKLLKGPDWGGIWTENVAANYHPLTLVSLAMNYQAGGPVASSFLWTNLLLHLINTLLVWLFVRKLANMQAWIPVFCAAIFALHPMHVESVAWISERKDLLYTLFFLLAAWSYINYIVARKAKWYALAFLLCLFSLLSKPAAVVLPVVFVLLDILKGRAFNRSVIFEKVPFFLAAIAAGIVTLQFQSETMASLEVHSPMKRLLFACFGTMTYIWKFFLPVHLSAFYPFPVGDLGAEYWFSPIVVAALAAMFWFFRKDKLIVFGMLFFLVNLVLVLQVVSVGQAVVAERYTYVPYVGLALVTGILISRRLKSPTLTWMLTGAIVLALGAATYARVGIWKNSETLWTSVIEEFPGSPLARSNRASYYIEKAGDITDTQEADAWYRKALADCDAALATTPKYAAALNERGRVRIRFNMLDGAVEDGTRLISVDPKSSNGYAIRGKAYAGLAQPDKALADLNQALLLKPGDANLLYDRGALLFNSFGKYDKALVDFNEAIAKDPKGLYFMTRSFCYYKLGKLDRAREDALAAQQLGTILHADYLALLGW